ncbi:MAG: arsenate reductase (glutaredoxin) [Polyangiales bacterium]
MTKVRIYHNPRCTKSRETLALLREHDVEPEVVEYLKQPPSEAELEQLLGKLGVEPHALLRTKEAPYAELGLSKKSTRSQIVAAIVAHPVLLERPIVVVGKRAAIGRPPENVLPLLENLASP